MIHLQPTASGLPCLRGHVKHRYSAFIIRKQLTVQKQKKLFLMLNHFSPSYILLFKLNNRISCHLTTATPFWCSYKKKEGGGPSEMMLANFPIGFLNHHKVHFLWLPLFSFTWIISVYKSDISTTLFKVNYQNVLWPQFRNTFWKVSGGYAAFCAFFNSILWPKGKAVWFILYLLLAHILNYIFYDKYLF